MADSFADLWATSAPIKPTKQPERLGVSTVQASSPSTRRPQRDAFSVLSAAQPTSRIHTPHILHQTRTQGKPAAAPQKRNATDAFSGLFDASMGFGGGSGNEGSMSMAQKAALAQKIKAQQFQQEKGKATTTLNSAIPSAWDGLDSLAQANTHSMITSPPQDDFDFAFGNANQTEHKDIGDDDDWGLSEFSSPQPVAQSEVQPKSSPLWDLNDFALAPPTQLPRSQISTPEYFESGDHQNSDHAMLDGNTQDDDILGDLGKPVQNHNTRPSPPSNTPPVSTFQPSSHAATVSPPPHITGQLVEMGFAPQLALTALLSTSTGDSFDTQTALDWLLAHREAVSPSEPNGDRLEDRDQHRDREREEHTPHGPPVRNTRHHIRPDPRSAQPSQPHSDVADFPASAERLISQASEIGRGVFSRANALFKEGREKAMKMYEERTGVAANRLAGSKETGPGSGDGRLRPAEGGKLHKGFRDDDSGDERESKPRSNGPSRRSPNIVQPQSPPPTDEVNFFGSDSPQVVYQSRFRRGKPKPESTPTGSSSDSIHVSSSRLSPSGPPRVPPRKLTAIIPSTIFTTYLSQKAAGTDAYKLGQYPTAVDAYSRALALLPEGHVLRLPLLTNRAVARSKVGELAGAGEDCSAAVTLVEELVGNVNARGANIGRVHVVVEGAVSTDGNTEVDLVNGLTKAYQRRAEAYEGLEKWTPALADWEVLVGAEWADAVRALATRGAARCRRMIGGNESVSDTMGPGRRPAVPSNLAQQPPKARPKARTPSVSVSTEDSPAVTALRMATNLAASEDAERHAHKDAVDGWLLAWRQGKETNIRALLTTLDGILWPELGWKKVSMAEVVGKGQVKVIYMRAIARVHPDKLNASNTTIEQRMIANGIFGTLNEAWNAFQQQ
ncbi:hypothetical protein J3A83DRAFT_4204061 [Scleroderma citrinum]